MLPLWSLLQTFDKIISSSQCDAILHEFARHEHDDRDAYESSIHASTGKRTQSTFRAYSLVPGTEAFDIAHQCTQNAVRHWLDYLETLGRFNMHVYRQCLRYSHDYRVLKYIEGAQIHPHTDWDHFTFASCTLALNDDYEGGEFAFFNGECTVRLRRGQAMVWPADCFWVHQVQPVRSKVRYSVNSFITAIPEALKVQAVDQLNALPQDAWCSPYRHATQPRA